MKKLAGKVKTTVVWTIDDFKTSIIHANNLLIYSSSKEIKIFLAAAIFILLITIYFSESKTIFYINFARVLFVSFTTYFIVCLSDYFWFLRKKKHVYQHNLNNRKDIKILIKSMNSDEDDKQNKINFEKEITSIVKFYSSEYDTHTIRYIIEICVLMIILLGTFPWFFIFNAAVFCAMFFYTYIYETQSVDQAYDDIISLLYYINNFHKKSPDKCEKFLAESEQEEIKNLVWLYIAVLRKK